MLQRQLRQVANNVLQLRIGAATLSAAEVVELGDLVQDVVDDGDDDADTDRVGLDDGGDNVRAAVGQQVAG
jgi:hypothetical protein